MLTHIANDNLYKCNTKISSYTKTYHKNNILPQGLNNIIFILFFFGGEGVG